jgi:hypothetical protein
MNSTTGDFSKKPMKKGAMKSLQGLWGVDKITHLLLKDE